MVQFYHLTDRCDVDTCRPHANITFHVSTLHLLEGKNWTTLVTLRVKLYPLLVLGVQWSNVVRAKYGHYPFMLMWCHWCVLRICTFCYITVNKKLMFLQKCMLGEFPTIQLRMIFEAILKAVAQLLKLIAWLFLRLASLEELRLLVLR